MAATSSIEINESPSNFMLKVSNLPEKIAIQEIVNIFKDHGTISDFPCIKLDKKKRVAYVPFTTLNDVEDLLAKNNGSLKIRRDTVELKLEKYEDRELENPIKIVANENENATKSPESQINSANCSEDASKHNRVTRAQKRRDKKDLKAKERQKMIDDSAADAKSSKRQTEIRSFKPILTRRGLKLVEISADGDCMYNAVAHQLSLDGLDYSAQQLRELTASTMLKNKDDFLPFMLAHDDFELLTDEKFDDYCKKVVTTTAWGGHSELKALSMGLRKRIEVLQVDGSPIVVGDESTDENPLIITYHRHAYRLGEHYNSTQPKTAGNESSDSDN